MTTATELLERAGAVTDRVIAELEKAHARISALELQNQRLLIDNSELQSRIDNYEKERGNGLPARVR